MSSCAFTMQIFAKCVALLVTFKALCIVFLMARSDNRCSDISGLSATNADEFWAKIRRLNIDLAIARSQTKIDKVWQDISNTSQLFYFFEGNRSDLMQQLAYFRQVRTVFMPWTSPDGSQFVPDRWTSADDCSNLLFRKYYTWTADKDLCYALTNEYGFDTCYVDARVSSRPTYLSSKYIPLFNIKIKQNVTFDGQRYRRYETSHWTSTYVHIVKNAIVTSDGDIISGNFKFAPFGCVRRFNGFNRSIPTREIYVQLSIFEEVFTISHLWGAATYHELIDVVPCLIPYLNFLRQNPKIMIHIPMLGIQIKPIFDILGLDRSRIVLSDIRAKVIYVPQATPCGHANAQPIQIWANTIRRHIHEKIRPQYSRNRLILIRRSRSRRFVEQEEIERVVLRAALDYNLTYTMFIDNPVPSLEETMAWFSSAIMVVAPHGAGLSNIVFSEPGTYVIEGTCYPRFTFDSFIYLAHVLGHRWHGLQSKTDCQEVVDVSADAVERSVRERLELWKNGAR